MRLCSLVFSSSLILPSSSCPLLLTANSMHLLKANRLIGAASRRPLKVGLDDGRVSSMLLETAEHLQQQHARQTKLLKPRMNANRLDLRDTARSIEPAHAESRQRSIRHADNQIEI